MESFLPSTTKLWNDFPDFTKISPNIIIQKAFEKHQMICTILEHV